LNLGHKEMSHCLEFSSLGLKVGHKLKEGRKTGAALVSGHQLPQHEPVKDRVLQQNGHLEP
jgi:hypothetical protein